ncbi:MAG TPA: hypothetical protein VF624_04260 [Tepidisphaeraceae bacterium]|jgi:hypothetical protein
MTVPQLCVRSLAVTACLLGSGASADVRLNPLIADHAVLQRDQPIPVFGTGVDGEAVTVRLGDDEAKTIVANGADLRLEFLGPQPAPATIALAGDWTYRRAVALSEAPPLPLPPRLESGTPTALYNAMLAPLQRVPIKGVIWYQGEANSNRAKQYQALLPAMIADWRVGPRLRPRRCSVPVRADRATQQHEPRDPRGPTPHAAEIRAHRDGRHH